MPSEQVRLDPHREYIRALKVGQEGSVPTWPWHSLDPPSVLAWCERPLAHRPSTGVRTMYTYHINSKFQTLKSQEYPLSTCVHISASGLNSTQIITWLPIGLTFSGLVKNIFQTKLGLSFKDYTSRGSKSTLPRAQVSSHQQCEDTKMSKTHIYSLDCLRSLEHVIYVYQN